MRIKSKQFTSCHITRWGSNSAPKPRSSKERVWGPPDRNPSNHKLYLRLRCLRTTPCRHVVGLLSTQHQMAHLLNHPCWWNNGPAPRLRWAIAEFPPCWIWTGILLIWSIPFSTQYFRNIQITFCTMVLIQSCIQYSLLSIIVSLLVLKQGMKFEALVLNTQ